MVVNILTRRHLLVGGVGCLVACGVMLAIWLGALAGGEVQPVLRPTLRNGCAMAFAIGIAFLLIRRFVRNPEPVEPETGPEYETDRI